MENVQIKRKSSTRSSIFTAKNQEQVGLINVNNLESALSGKEQEPEPQVNYCAIFMLCLINKIFFWIEGIFSHKARHSSKQIRQTRRIHTGFNTDKKIFLFIP
jgi:hypothetical protein